MTDDYQTSTRNFIRGGQVLLHNYRMLKQLFDRALVFAAVVFFTVTIGLTYLRINEWDIFALKQWSVANVFHFFDDNSKQKVIYPAGRVEIVSATAVIKAPWITNRIKYSGELFLLSMLYGAISSIISLFLVFVYLRRRGKLQSETKKLRGYEVGDIKKLNKIIKKTGASDIKIAGVSMPKNFETGHILVHGTTGMGKSVCIKELLDEIRKRGDRVIIYDQGCDYIGSFYEKDDIILNPLDDRTASWHLWKECRDSADYDGLAASLIPNPSEYSEQFWNNSARVVFTAIAKSIKKEKTRSLSRLLEIALVDNLIELERYLKTTEAASLVSDRNDRTSLSIRAVLGTYLKGLSYVKEEQNAFSIRDWIQDDKKKNWLFISSRADRHETLKPLISMWLDLAANSLMSLPPSQTRRIWLIFDELASLHKLPYLPSAFAQSRKFGGCIVAGIQSISQLSKIYGLNASNEISSMCNTRIFFRSPSSEAAVWTSKELGQHEIEEMKEGISYSESAMRSGISIGKQRVQKDLISPAEIMQLPALEAYMRLPGGLPITNIKLEFKKREEKAVPFIARVIPESKEQKPAETPEPNNGIKNYEETETKNVIANSKDQDRILSQPQPDKLAVDLDSL